jgi:chromosome segregation ATPase
MKGRPQSVNFSPKEFQELSREERVLRGRISTLKKMIQRREDKIDELMKPVLKKKSEVNSLKEELGELKNQIKELGVKFPTFRVEEFSIKKGKDENGDDKYHSYYRGVWYVNSKKKQLYMGSEKKVQERMNEVIDGFDKLHQSQKNEKILEVYLPEFQMNFWEKEYEEFKKDK